jgi:C1A family cysteine protease
MEYLQRRSGFKHVDLSKSFLYKVTRRLLGWTGDTGAFIRTAIKAAALFGVPPEEQWPYDLGRFDEEPEAFLYAYAANFSALNYARLDRYGTSGDRALEEVRRVVAAGFPVAFGFPVYSSLTDAPDIPYPDPRTDRHLGGHAVVAVGYDDARAIAGNKGALLLRNSWGTGWGDGGYGWLPYAYVEDQLAEDFWSIFKQDWIDETRFE